MPKESQQPQRRKRFVLLLTVALSLTSVALGTWALAMRDRTDQNEVASDVDFSDLLATIDFDAAANLDAERLVYRYSVIPGGAYTADELRHAIRVDPIVAAHYEDLDQSKLQVRTVARDQYAYVSYRKGDEVLWTKTKVLLRQGETIISDGTRQVRAKCGNCISSEPQLPTAAEEPEVVEFDRLVDPDPASVPAGETEVPLVPPSSPVASVAPAAAQPAAPAVEPLAAGQFAIGSSSPLAAGNPGPGNNPDMPGPPVDVSGPDTPLPPFTPQPPDVVHPPPDVMPPPPGNLPPLTDDPPREEPPLWEPPTDQPPGEPNEPVQVPEPGTLLLVGGGIAALVRRHLRGRSR